MFSRSILEGPIVQPPQHLMHDAGAVIVGSELRGRFWVVRPRGRAFVATPLATTLAGPHYNLEGAVYLAG